MSRYTISAMEPRKHSCVVGYDDPLQTFFAVIEDKEAIAYNTNLLKDDEYERPEIIFVNGQLTHEVNTIQDLEISIEKWAVIPDHIKEKLVQDRENSPGPNDFQKYIINIVEGLIKKEKNS